jgi:predicted polyphosphate/ATP-dependent NAD kinase
VLPVLTVPTALREDRRLGLVVNPVAGVGGPAGLKGSDGGDVQALARARGSRSHTHDRAREAMEVLAQRARVEVLTSAGSMGERAVLEAGLDPVVVHTPTALRTDPCTATAGTREGAQTTAADTMDAVRALVAAGAGLVLCVGGDGTLRDASQGLGDAALLGVPAGVKMYSGAFAVGARAAGAVAAAWLRGGVPLQQREVLDVDEAALPHGRVSPRLVALVPVPVAGNRTQARKVPTPAGEAAAVQHAARGVVAAMEPGVAYLLGPGGTTAEVAAQLGLRGTLLGVDVVRDGRLVVADADDRTLLEVARSGPAVAVLTVTGGQGFLLGRGNQQVGAAVLEAIHAVDGDGLIVVATPDKLAGLHGRPLLVDTGDITVDRRLAGYRRVVTGGRDTTIYRVSAVADQEEDS